MAESLSDIFSESDLQYGADSESPNGESEVIEKLKEQIETLQKENKSLASQFEGTIAIANQIESLNTELSRTKNQNRQLSAENEDLNHRLELTIKSKNEIVKQMEEERKGSAQTRNENYINARQEVEKQKAFYQKQLDAANDRVEQLIADEESNSVARKLAESKLDRVVQSAQRFFNQEFLSFDDFAAFLAQPQNDICDQQPIMMEVAPQQEDDPRLYEVAAKLRSAKEKSRQLSAVNKQLLATNNDLQKKLDESERCLKATSDDYEAKISCGKDAEKEKDNLIAELQRKVSSLKTQAEKAQSSLSAAEEKLAIKPQVVVQKVVDTKKITELKAAFEEEKEKMILENASLNQKLTQQTSKNQDLSAKLEKTTEELSEVTQESEKMKNEIQAITIVRDNALSDAQALRTALHQKQPRVEQKPQPKPLISKSELSKLKEDFEAQKKEIVSLQIEQTRNLSTIDEQRIQISDLKHQVESMEEESKKKSMDLNEALAKINKKPEVTVDDLLPAETWRTNDFGSDVSIEISNIASNASLQPISKLRAIYSTIRAAHQKEIQNVEEINVAVATELQDVQSCFSKFLVDVSVALTDNAFTLDDYDEKGGSSIISGISQLRTNYDNMKHMYDSMQSTLNNVMQSLGLPEDSEFNSILDGIEVLVSQFNQNAQLLDEEKKKFKILKKSYKEAARKNQENEAQLIKEKEEVEKDNECISHQNAELNKELSAVKKENVILSKNLNEVSGELEETKASFDSELESRVQNAKAECEALANELKIRLEESNKIAEENEKQVAAYEEKMKDTQKKIFELTNEKSQIAVELSAAKVAMKENEKELKEKYEAEKIEIKKNFDSAVEQLKEQCSNQAQDLTKLATSNSALETKIAKVKVAYSKLLSEKKKIENESKFALEQFERDRRLVEVQCRSKIVAAENSFNTKLEEVTANQENELRRIFTFTAENFKLFFNPSSTFNERNFRALVEKVKDELAALSASDEHIRRMLGARENQSTEDAVALLLLHRF